MILQRWIFGDLESRSVNGQFETFCSDFYINQKLALTMDLPEGRESVLDLFGRIRRELPFLDRLGRNDMRAGTCTEGACTALMFELSTTKK